MARKNAPADPFAQLTWQDLEDWAGSRIVARGRGYQRDGCVSNLARTADGGLLAWVDGTERYATLVHIHGGELESDCTCPYGLECKHAVAVVLEHLERLKNNQPVPKAPPDDKRLRLLEEDDEDEWALDDEEELEEDEPARNGVDDSPIARFLEKKTKAELVRLIGLLVARNPGLRVDILDRERLEKGEAQPIVKRLRHLIREAFAEPDWDEPWGDGGFTTNFSVVREKLQELLDAGHADEVLTLGREILEHGQELVGRANDEGETAEEVAACVPVIEKALRSSSMPPAKRLLWVVDLLLADEYDICDGLAAHLALAHAKEDWSTLADSLAARLSGFKTSRTDEHRSDYERRVLSDWLIRALREAGRDGEIIPLCEREATVTKSYPRLVKLLMDARRYPEAERWIHTGIEATDDRLPGISAALRNLLLEIRRRSGDKAAVAELRVDEFVRRPGVDSFVKCKQAAKKLKIWEPVRLALLTYLETGAYPWTSSDWPLPQTGTEISARVDRRDFPEYEELIAIAIHEKLPDRVLHWFDRMPSRGFGWFGSLEERVADAVRGAHPDRAAAIWKKLAERLIEEVKPRAYREAAVHLRKLKNLLAENGRTEEWRKYVARVRAEHARKRSLLAELDKLEKTPIIKGR